MSFFFIKQMKQSMSLSFHWLPSSYQTKDAFCSILPQNAFVLIQKRKWLVSCFDQSQFIYLGKPYPRFPQTPSTSFSKGHKTTRLNSDVPPPRWLKHTKVEKCAFNPLNGIKAHQSTKQVFIWLGWEFKIWVNMIMNI